MAGGQIVDWEGYRFTAKPSSRWRRLMKDFLPYWQASKPTFDLQVTRVGPPTQSQTMNWGIRFETGDVTGGQETIPLLGTDESATFKVGGKLLGFTGDTLLILPTNLASLNFSQYNTVYSFHTTPKVWIFLAAVAGFIAGAFASLCQYLFGL